MKSTLIVLNYQREIPPFMQTQLFLASGYFENIIYVTRDLEKTCPLIESLPNVEVLNAGNCRSSVTTVRSIGGSLLNGGISTIFNSARQGRLSLAFVKKQLVYDCASWLLYKTASRAIDRYGEENCTVLSAWFMAEAYAAVLLKKRYPGLRTSSFAHSFEVQVDRDPDLDLRHLRDRHRYIDDIFFISGKVLSEYQSSYLLPMGIDQGNIHTYYLGCINDGVGSRCSSDGRTRILTCSSVNSIKRLPLLVDALALIPEELQPSVVWSHMGSGPDFDALKKYAHTVLGDCMEWNLLGQKSNSEVMDYYTQEPVDLFINISSMEGLPVSIMESLSYGVPVIATNVGGTSELVRDGQTGYLLSPKLTAANLADAIVDFIRMGSRAKAEMKSECRMLWHESFDARENAASLYSNLMED